MVKMEDKNAANPLTDKTSFFWTPDYLAVSAWMEHIPFAFWIVEVWKPKIIVELGVHNAVSYFSFCQAVKRLNLDSTCWGIDIWTGDEHAGFYQEEVFDKVKDYNQKEYSRFSTLIRSTFDEAHDYFIDGSIDCLHIDGLHTYEAVKHDFATWFPKLAKNAIVIFHDINVRERNFGVFKLWEELKQQYNHFQFDFGHGLGIIAIGDVFPKEIRTLLANSSDMEYYIFLRNFFSDRGSFFKYRFDTIQLLNQHITASDSRETSFLQLTESAQLLDATNNELRQKNESLSLIVEELKEINAELKFNYHTAKNSDIESSITNAQLKESQEAISIQNSELLKTNMQLERGNRELKDDYQTIKLHYNNIQENLNDLTITTDQSPEKYKAFEVKYQLTGESTRELGMSNELLSKNVNGLVLKLNQVKDSYCSLTLANQQLANTNQQLQLDNSKLRDTLALQVEAFRKLLEDWLVLESQQKETVAVKSNLKEKMEVADYSFNNAVKELVQQNDLLEGLKTQVNNQQTAIAWYKATYEERTLMGVLKEKLAREFKKKIVSEKETEPLFPATIIEDERPNKNEGMLLLTVASKTGFKKAEYYLNCAQQINARSNSGEYTSTGMDPYFLVDLKNNQLKAGWYWLSLNIKVVDGTLLSPMLYFDYGRGFNEEDIWRLPAIVDDTISCLINFSSDILQLRFDPTTTASTFTLTEFTLKATGSIKVFQIGMSRYKKIYLPDENNLSFYTGLVTTFLKTGKLDLREKVRQAIYHEKHSLEEYKLWCKLYDTVSPSHLAAIKKLSSGLAYQPVFSIVMPVYNAPVIFLKKAIDSVINQAYQNWELCIADDKSTNEAVGKLLKEYKAKDDRIKIVFREINGHISKASNSALAFATGDFIVLLDQDDELPAHSLYMVASVLNKNKNLEIIYSDEDKMDESGNRFDPYFKTDWNRELFYGQNMISHLGVYKHALIKKIGGFREGYEGSQDYDLALRCIEHLKPEQIYHIPHVLYHWRALNGSTAITISNKSYAVSAGLRALQDHFSRTAQRATPVENIHNSFRIKWALPKKVPLVSIIIPTRDKVEVLSTCISSLLQNTGYPNFEILIIDNNSEEALTLAYFEKVQREQEQVKVFSFKGEFNFSAMNNFGVRQSEGEVLVLLNNDTEVINRDWLNEMVSQCMREEVGAVGAKLYYPNGQIQHAGVFLFEAHPGIHIYLKRDKNDPGYFNKLNLVQNYLALTAACLAVRKEVYIKAGGLDDENLKVAYNDVDFCLKLTLLGYKNVWTPFAQLTHHESLSRGNDLDENNLPRFKTEQSFILNKWNNLMVNDPFFNHNLGVDTTATQFAFPPRIAYEWQKAAD